MRTGRFQRRQKTLLIMHPPCATAIAFGILGKIDLHQWPVQPPGKRVAVAVFRAKAAHSVPHLQVVNTAEAGVIKQQNGDFYPLLHRRLQLGVQHHV